MNRSPNAPVTAWAVSIAVVGGDAALLSGVPKKDRTHEATGGLLRQVGEFGIVLLKDFTSIISMHRDARANALAALPAAALQRAQRAGD